MKYLLLIPSIFLLFSCNIKLSEEEVKAKLHEKCLSSLKCDSNSEIVNVRIVFIRLSPGKSNEYSFSGSYTGKNIIKYEGEFSGIAISNQGKVDLQELKYLNKLNKGNVKSSCLNY